MLFRSVVAFYLIYIITFRTTIITRSPVHPFTRSPVPRFLSRFPALFLETINSDHDFADFAFCVFTWACGVRSLFGVHGVDVFYIILFYGAKMMQVGGITLVASLSHHRARKALRCRRITTATLPPGPVRTPSRM